MSQIWVETYREDALPTFTTAQEEKGDNHLQFVNFEKRV